ncbi:MAG: cytochrome C [Marinosulfonomonas sp.]|nr:MAG: cytochrome C [Marinosulfonomonas sp.]
MKNKLIGLAVLAVIGAITIKFWNDPITAAQPTVTVEIKVPQFSTAALDGQQTFNSNCAVCHGENAAGTDQGPSFLQKTYGTTHHADFAITLAVKNGVRAHHWRFGSMSPVPGITDDEIAGIVAYIREMQQANGLE